MKTARLITIVLVGLLATTGSIALAQGQRVPATKDDPAAPPRGLRVFYVSHSLMWYVPAPLGELAEATGIKGHTVVGLQKIGGSRTLQHWNLPDDKNLAKTALKSGKIDVLVMSPIQFPDEGLENYIKLGLEHNPNVRFVIQVSWGGGDIDNQDFPKGAWDKVDREKTPEQLRTLNACNIHAGHAQADALNAKYGKGRRIVTLVPTCQAHVALRSQIANKDIPGLTRQGELFVDAAHPSPPLEALNTYLHFAVLYGQNPVGLPMPELLKKAKRPAWDERLNRALQELAWDAVTQYPYSGVTAAKGNAQGRQ